MNPLHPTQGEKGKDDLLPIQPCGEGPSDYSVPDAANTAALAELLARIESGYAEGAPYSFSCALGDALGAEQRYAHPGSLSPSHLPYATSLDAALALVERVLPEGQGVDLFIRGSSTVAGVWADEDIDVRAHRKTPALALLAAMLKALIAKGSEQ